MRSNKADSTVRCSRPRRMVPLTELDLRHGFLFKGNKAILNTTLLHECITRPPLSTVILSNSPPLIPQDRKENISPPLSLNLCRKNPPNPLIPERAFINHLPAQHKDLATQFSSLEHLFAVIIPHSAKARVSKQQRLPPVLRMDDAGRRDPARIARENDVAAVGERYAVYLTGFEGTTTHYDGVVTSQGGETGEIPAERRPWETAEETDCAVAKAVGYY